MPLSGEIRKTLIRIPGVRRAVLELEDRIRLRQHNRRYPELQWRPGPRCPQPRVEPARAQIGSKLYVVGGYVQLDLVSDRVDMLDLETGRWSCVARLPDGAPQTHQAMTHDGRRHVFMVAGQVGINCAPATSRCYVLDCSDHSWSSLPSLPAPRYMPVVHYYKGRLHCMTGNREDRASNADEHWSIAIEDGCAIEKEWRYEGRFPHPRIHTSTELVGGEVIVMSGQEGDVPRKGGAPDYLCNFDSPNDIMHDEVFAYHLETREVRHLSPMPEAISHSECAVNRVGSKIILAGGILHRRIMADRIYSYDLEKDRWELIGRLPHPMKSKVTAVWNDRLYLVAGQRSVSDENLRPGPVVDSVFYAELPESHREPTAYDHGP